MEKHKNEEKLIRFKGRKWIHYFLIISILLIQLLIAGLLYNEFKTRENNQFFSQQLKDITTLERLTNRSRNELLSAQYAFQNYITYKDDKHFSDYVGSVKKLASTIEDIHSFKGNNNPVHQNEFLKSLENYSLDVLRTKIDSTSKIVYKKERENVSPQILIPTYELPKNINWEDEVVETHNFSDSVKKKGLFGRLKDAFSGKVNVKKDSTIVKMTHQKSQDLRKIKKEVDSILKVAHQHYSDRIKVLQRNIIYTKDNTHQFLATFNNLLIYSNELITIYDGGIKNAKIELEKELQNRQNNTENIRTKLLIGLFIFMFLVSIILMYFTRVAFLYESKLKTAHDEIQESLNFKNRILGMLSHELRSPLKMMGIFVNRIQRKNEDPLIDEYLKSINFTNKSLLIQANQILEYTKNQQIKNKLYLTVFNVREEITSILTAIRPYIETRNNIFTTHISIPESLVVHSDDVKINQLFMNILGNANKFTEDGSISIEVFTDEVVDHRVKLTAIMKDTGIGISPTDLKNIFEPFYQGVLSNEVENLGAGLGLSLCKEIVELYGGKISVKSVQNIGTEVFFSIFLDLDK